MEGQVLVKTHRMVAISFGFGTAAGLQDLLR
jgi:hypothetical protein